MTAKLKAVQGGYEAVFERNIPHAAEQVWSMLTVNDKLSRWFPELRVAELGAGGHLQFDMGGGAFEVMDITDYSAGTVLEYTWGEDKVRFELTRLPDGCRLQLTEVIGRLTDHTAKDLAGWDVCLEAIAALLDGEELRERKQIWEKRYPDYRDLVQAMRES